MRCLVCGGEMRVELVVRDRTMPVAGFAHHTLTCVACGETEQRLAFAQESPATSVPVPTPPELLAPDPTASPDSAAAPSPLPENERPRSAWAQAIERTRMHQAILAERATLATTVALPEPTEPTKPTSTTGADVIIAADIAAATPAPAAMTSDEFDRLWDSLARPLPVPVPSGAPAIIMEASDRDTVAERPLDVAPIAAPPVKTTPLMITPVETTRLTITPVETTPLTITPVETTPLMITAVETPPISSVPPAAPKAVVPVVIALAPAISAAAAPAVSLATTSFAATRLAASSAWARAVSKVRSRMPQSNDVILGVGGQAIPQVSEEALPLPRRRPASRA